MCAKAYLDLWRPQIAAAKEQGKEFVVGKLTLLLFDIKWSLKILKCTPGEYNSVSCSGKENVTDTFGQALWLADSEIFKGDSISDSNGL